jgi:hypothetical protein
VHAKTAPTPTYDKPQPGTVSALSGLVRMPQRN